MYDLPSRSRASEDERARPSRTLYFDIDGTLVYETFGAPKRDLANGRFEKAVRAAGFDRLVCVSDAVMIARVHRDLGRADDPLNIIFSLCRGTIQDEDWFRSVTTLVPDPQQRCAFIDPTEDWYYVDDWARMYLRRSGALANGDIRLMGPPRVLRCRSESDGEDVRAWLDTIGAHAPAIPGPAGRRRELSALPTLRSAS